VLPTNGPARHSEDDFRVTGCDPAGARRARQELDRVLTLIAANMGRVEEAWATNGGPLATRTLSRRSLGTAFQTPVGPLLESWVADDDARFLSLP
jgi:hypothetical protein